MRILLINHFPLEGSGSGTYTKNLAMQLVECEHEVCVCAPQHTPDFPRYSGIQMHPVYFTPEESTFEQAPHAGQAHQASLANQSTANVAAPGLATAEPAIAGSNPATPLPFNFPCFTTHPASTLAFGSLSPEQLAAYTEAFRTAIEAEVEQFAPQIIHGQHIWILSSLTSDLGIPLVLTAHGTDLMGYEKWPHLRPFAQQAMDACEKVICISRDNENLVKESFPEHAHKIVPMRNGYNPAIFFQTPLAASQVLAKYYIPCENKTVVLFAGKLTHFKGVDVLLNAVQIYEEQLPHAITLVAGDGELREQLQAQAQDLHLERLYFLGNVSQADLCELYNIASLSVVPSRREPFGLVAVEAMACGTPVVATNEGGLPDFVNENVGALVGVEQPEELAQAIVAVHSRALEQPQWRTNIAQYAAANYSQAAIIHELESLYSSVCK